MDKFQALKQQGNLLESLMGTHKEANTIEILRVYPYESRVGNVFFACQRNHMKDSESLPILKIIDQIREKCEEKKWNDNKIVVELFIGFHHIFLGFWDNRITIGNSVIPNPTRNPRYKTNVLGNVEPVIVRK